MQEEYFRNRLQAIRKEIKLLEAMLGPEEERPKRKSSFTTHLERTYTGKSWRKPASLKKQK